MIYSKLPNSDHTRVKRRGEIREEFREFRELLRCEKFAHRKHRMFRDFAKFARLSSRKQLAKFAKFASLSGIHNSSRNSCAQPKVRHANTVNYRNEQYRIVVAAAMCFSHTHIHLWKNTNFCRLKKIRNSSIIRKIRIMVLLAFRYTCHYY